MAAGDVLWDGASGYQWAVVEVPTSTTPAGIARAAGVVVLNAAGVATTPLVGYTEDAASASDPIGPMMMGRRRDTLTAAEVSATGDNIALNATSKGELHTRNLALEALLPTALAANGGLKIEGVAGGVAVPVSSTTLATAAKQPALGTAGTASADVISVQGIASMTPLLVTPTAPLGGAYTDRSIASLAGTSETLMAGNASRRILVVHNIGGTAIAVNLTGGAASLTVGGSVVLAAGGSLVLDHYPPTALIKVIGTATAAVTAYEG